MPGLSAGMAGMSEELQKAMQGKRSASDRKKTAVEISNTTKAAEQRKEERKQRKVEMEKQAKAAIETAARRQRAEAALHAAISRGRSFKLINNLAFRFRALRPGDPGYEGPPESANEKDGSHSLVCRIAAGLSDATDGVASVAHSLKAPKLSLPAKPSSLVRLPTFSSSNVIPALASVGGHRHKNVYSMASVQDSERNQDIKVKQGDDTDPTIKPRGGTTGSGSSSSESSSQPSGWQFGRLVLMMGRMRLSKTAPVAPETPFAHTNVATVSSQPAADEKHYLALGGVEYTSVRGIDEVAEAARQLG